MSCRLPLRRNDVDHTTTLLTGCSGSSCPNQAVSEFCLKLLGRYRELRRPIRFLRRRLLTMQVSHHHRRTPDLPADYRTGIGQTGDVNDVIEPAHGRGVHVLLTAEFST
jgi:hypothetical protein